MTLEERTPRQTGVLLDVLVRRVELRLDDAGGFRRGVALVLGLLQLLLEFDQETAFTALEAKTKASEQRASDEGTATQGLRVKLEGMEADRAWPRRWRGGFTQSIRFDRTRVSYSI